MNSIKQIVNNSRVVIVLVVLLIVKLIVEFITTKQQR